MNIYLVSHLFMSGSTIICILASVIIFGLFIDKANEK